MAAAIYLEKNNVLELKKGTSSTQELGELTFYVYSKIGELPKQVFLIMKDNQGMREIIELDYKGVDATRPYKLYKPGLRQSVRVTSGTVTMQIMVLIAGTDDYFLSTPLTVNVTTEQYNLTRQVYLTQELGSRVQGYYEEIVKLFKQLIIEKGDSLNESNNYS